MVEIILSCKSLSLLRVPYHENKVMYNEVSATNKFKCAYHMPKKDYNLFLRDILLQGGTTTVSFLDALKPAHVGRCTEFLLSNRIFHGILSNENH